MENLPFFKKGLLSPELIMKVVNLCMSHKVDYLNVIAAIGTWGFASMDKAEDDLRLVRESLIKLERCTHDSDKKFEAAVDEIIAILRDLLLDLQKRMLGSTQNEVICTENLYLRQGPGYKLLDTNNHRRHTAGGSKETTVQVFSDGKKYPITETLAGKGKGSSANIAVYAIGDDGENHEILRVNNAELEEENSLNWFVF